MPYLELIPELSYMQIVQAQIRLLLLEQSEWDLHICQQHGKKVNLN